MTNETLLETYQSVKELIADNLQEKGVNASSDDGLTTLAGKILDIEESEETPEETKTISCKAVWNDNSNDKGIRPNSVKVFLYKDGGIYKSQTISNSNSYQCQFTNCPVNHTYTIEFSENYYYTQEILEEGDSGITNGFDFQCNYTVKTGTIIIQYQGLPNDSGVDNSGIDFHIRLYGPDPDCPRLFDRDDFTNNRIQINNYLIGNYCAFCDYVENPIPEMYIFSFDDSTLTIPLSLSNNATSLFNLLLDFQQAEEEPNPLDEMVDIPVVIMFSDNDNEDLMRPDNVTVRLYADGVEVDMVSIDSSMGWRYTFTDEPRYNQADLSEIEYQINCDPVPAYTKEIRGYTVTLIFHQEQKSLTIQKVWSDDNNSEGLRPTSLGLVLKRNNENYRTVVLKEDDNWSATTSVPIYYNGEEAEYSWVEGEISYYVLQEMVTQENITTLTNTLQQRPENPPSGKTPK